jgi:hypothetical protein
MGTRKTFDDRMGQYSASAAKGNTLRAGHIRNRTNRGIGSLLDAHDMTLNCLLVWDHYQRCSREQGVKTMDYNVHIITRIEHKRMVDSIRPVPEYGYNLAVKQPGLLSRQAGRILSALKNGLTMLRQPRKQETDVKLNVPVAE